MNLTSKEQEELSVAFLFLINGRPLKEWVPALLAANEGAGSSNWHLRRELDEHSHIVTLYSLHPSEVHERLDQQDKNTTASDELIYQKLTMLHMGDIFYEHGSYAIDELISELEQGELVFENWFAENGVALYGEPYKWNAEGAYFP